VAEQDVVRILGVAGMGASKPTLAVLEGLGGSGCCPPKSPQ